MPFWNTLNPKHQRTFKSETTFFLKLQQHRLSGKVLLVVNTRQAKSLISSNAGCLDTSGMKISPWEEENQSYHISLKQGEHRSTKVRWKLKFKKSATKNIHEECGFLLLPLTAQITIPFSSALYTRILVFILLPPVPIAHFIYNVISLVPFISHPLVEEMLRNNGYNPQCLNSGKRKEEINGSNFALSQLGLLIEPGFAH